jgi:N-acetyl-anhydromuramyl-L-alanine amidase AmpD
MPPVQYTPDPAYIAQIEALLKQYDVRDPNLFTFDRTTYRSPNFLTPAQLPVARNPNTIVETVWHKTEGHLQGDMSRLLSPSAQVSCHAYIPRSLSENNRTIYMVVDFENEAWQCGVSLKADQLGGSFRQYLGWDNENYRSVGNETEGSETEGFTPWQMLACIWLQLYLLRKYPNMRADRDHIIGHYQITRQKSDPQLFPWEVFMDAVQNAHTPACRSSATPCRRSYRPRLRMATPIQCSISSGHASNGDRL